MAAGIRVLRLLEKFTLAQLASAIECALDIDVIDAASIRTIVEHRSDQPVELFPLDGRPHLAHVRVETTDVASYQALLAACAQGRKARFFRVTELITLLLEAKEERQLLRLHQQLGT